MGRVHSQLNSFAIVVLPSVESRSTNKFWQLLQLLLTHAMYCTRLARVHITFSPPPPTAVSPGAPTAPVASSGYQAYSPSAGAARFAPVERHATRGAMILLYQKNSVGSHNGSRRSSEAPARGRHALPRARPYPPQPTPASRRARCGGRRDSRNIWLVFRFCYQH